MTIFSGMCCRDHQVLHGSHLRLFEDLPNVEEVYIFQMWRGEGVQTPVDCPYIKYTPFVSRDLASLAPYFDLANFSSPRVVGGVATWTLELSNKLSARLLPLMQGDEEYPWCQVLVGHFGDPALTYIVFRASSLSLFEACQEWVDEFASKAAA